MSEPQKSSVSGSLSLIALSKTLMLIRKTFAKPSESAFLTTESFDLSNRNDLKLFNFLLKKPLKTKQEEQIVFTTLKAFPFFEKLDPLVSSSLLQNFSDYFEYTSNPSGSTIYQTGDEGDFFYIILSGSIFVLISKSGLMPAEFKVESPKRESSPDSPQSFKLFTDVVEKIEKVEELSLDRYKKKLKIGRNQSFLFKTSGFELLSQEIERRSPTKRNEYMIQRINKIINYKYPEYFIAHELKAGESFGEVALITNSKRNEICICKEICHFLKISKNNYKKIMMLSHAKDLKELIVFFKNFNIFSHWPRAQLSTFIKFFQTNVFTNNDVLYKENDESNFLYFIKEGEVEISKIVTFDGKEEDTKKMQGNIGKNSIFDIKRFQLYNAYWQENFQKKNSKRAKLAILGPGSYFGEEEFFANTTRITKAVVKTRSVIYFIKHEFFSMNVKTKITLDKIKEEYMMKENWRKKLIKKGFHDDNAKPLIKAISLHSDRVPLQSDRINTDKQDFQERTPFKFKQFVRAKKQVLKKRKEFLEKTQNLLEQNKKNENQKKIPYISESNKSNYKLDLTKLFNHEPMLSTKIKANKTSKFSYIFHEDDLSFKEKNFNTPVMGNDGKICDKSLKTEDSRKQISQRVKGKFEIALERLKKKKEALNINNISIKPNESESEARKNSLQKFINLMFKDRKKLKREENETNIENFERNKPMRNNPSSNVNRSKNNASLFRESCSQLYLYNNSFQNKSNATDNVNFETDRESKCVNIHVEKRKNSKKKNNNSVKALIYFKKAMKQGILSQESLK